MTVGAYLHRLILPVADVVPMGKLLSLLHPAELALPPGADMAPAALWSSLTGAALITADSPTPAAHTKESPLT